MRSIVIGVLLALLTSAPAAAVELASWGIVGDPLDSNAPYPADGVDAVATAGDLRKAPALLGVVASERYLAAGWPVGTPLDLGRYFELDAAPVAGFELSLDRLDFSLYGASGGSASWEVRSDVDGFSAALDSGFVADVFGGGSGALVSADLSSLGSQAGVVTFRIYLYDNLGGNPMERGFVGFMGGGTGVSLHGTPLWNGKWEQRNAPGFGDPSDDDVTSLVHFGAHLYAGTGEGKIWRSTDGASWAEVADLSRGVSLGAIFQGALYAGTTDFSGGGQLFRSFDGLNWASVSSPGFGDATNVSLLPSVVFEGQLYAVTGNSSPSAGDGGEIWRSSDGTSWTQVDSAGFGNAENWFVRLSPNFGGYLYAGTANFNQGAELFRSDDGLNWTSIATAGFGDAGNQSFFPGGIYDGHLYLGTTNQATGGEVWRSSNGTTWSQVSPDGFGDSGNVVTAPVYAFGDTLYALTTQFGLGGEIWTSTNGTAWTQDSDAGFGDANNWFQLAIEGFGTGLYVGTSKDRGFGPGGGGEVWAALPEPASFLGVWVGGLLVAGLAFLRRR